MFNKIVKGATKAEEERKVTDTHGAPEKKKTKKPEPIKKPRKAAVDTQPSDDVSQYQPGETWQTTGGNWGGKNKTNQIKYFGSKERAQAFATK